MTFSNRFIALCVTFFLSCCAVVFSAGQTNDILSNEYRLLATDLVDIFVYEEEDLTLSQRIDGEGKVNIPLIKEIVIAGLTLREAEQKIEHAFLEQRFLCDPHVILSVAEYSTNEISIFGQVSHPGQIVLPLEESSLDIVELIARAGGFNGIAKGSAVKITRGAFSSGETQHIEVNVLKLIQGDSRGKNAKPCLVYPGDIVYVPERIF